MNSVYSLLRMFDAVDGLLYPNNKKIIADTECPLLLYSAMHPIFRIRELMR